MKWSISHIVVGGYNGYGGDNGDDGDNADNGDNEMNEKENLFIDWHSIMYQVI